MMRPENEMQSLRKLGYWVSLIEIVLAVAYLAAVAAMFITGTIPPAEPYVSIVSVVSLASAPLFVFLWVILHNTAPSETRIFTQTSLAMVVIFATLTSINRYVALTVVRQSMDMGITDGLNWFMPYGWPSIMAAMEVLAWGFFLGLAFLFLAPIFRKGKLELAIFWTLQSPASLAHAHLAFRLQFMLFQALIALISLLQQASTYAAWDESARWWTLVVSLANFVSIYLLVRLYKAEGKRFFDIFKFSRATWKKDLLWFILKYHRHAHRCRAARASRQSDLR
jgi:hypothetical protein